MKPLQTGRQAKVEDQETPRLTTDFTTRSFKQQLRSNFKTIEKKLRDVENKTQGGGVPDQSRIHSLLRRALGEEVFLTMSYSGPLPKNPKALPCGVVVPRDCKLKEATIRVDTTSSIVGWLKIDIVDYEADAALLAEIPIWKTAENGISKKAKGINPPPPIKAGSYIYPDFSAAVTDNEREETLNFSATITLQTNSRMAK
jgi:hypothetical protein